MAGFLHPLMLLIARATDSELAVLFFLHVGSRRVHRVPTHSLALAEHNPFAETWVRAIKMNASIISWSSANGERHLTYLIQDYLTHYHQQRPHQGLVNRPPHSTGRAAEMPPISACRFAVRERLGGVLKHYERVAA